LAEPVEVIRADVDVAARVVRADVTGDFRLSGRGHQGDGHGSGGGEERRFHILLIPGGTMGAL